MIPFIGLDDYIAQKTYDFDNTEWHGTSDMLISIYSTRYLIRPIAQIHKFTTPMSHNAPFCYIFYKMVHYEIFV